MGAIEIVEVESTSQLKKFITLPNKLYGDDPNFVSHLLSERLEFFDKKKNPFYRYARTKLIMARRDGEFVGRIATCINFTHNEVHAEKAGFFGFFDCIDDFEVASTLLKVAMINLKKEGMEIMRGPMNFSTNHECAFLIEGFDSPPVVMMPYNPPYIPKLAEQFGLKKAVDLVAYKLTKGTGISQRISGVVDRLMKRSNISIRPINMKDFENELDRVNEIYNSAWEQNWGFVPLYEDEFRYTARNLKQVLDPDLALIAEHEGKPVAFLLSLPDINQALIHLNGRLFPTGLIKLLWHTKIRNKIDGIRVITLGVIPEYQRRGIDSMLYTHIFNKGVEKGYQWAELSWILEDNELMRSAADQMGAQVYKRYRIMETPLYTVAPS
jgi:GNAT superfamily N-acetyltransferase